MKTSIGIILPCYNEEEILNISFEKLNRLVIDLKSKDKINDSSKIIFVDDGSKDATWNIIESLCSANPMHCMGLKLSRNYGHQNALLAGLMEFKADFDCLISIDADLQDDYLKIEEMVDKYKEGFEVVYGVRDKRHTDTYFKRNTAKFFYRLMLEMDIELIPNHADFRLMGQKSLHALAYFNERNLFLRGIIPQLGFRSTSVYYDRKEREAGETKYPLKKMISFAIKGITSFSITPLRLCFYIGLFICVLCLSFVLYALYGYINDITVPGWASTVIPIYFLGGIQLLSIGVVGEYVGKIYSEVKKRPHFIIDRKIKF